MVEYECEEKNIEPNDTIVVLGKTGSGKSSILNSISNNQFLFPEGKTLSSTTKELQKHKSLFRGQSAPFLWLIDTPGLFDTEGADEKYIRQLLEGLKYEQVKIVLFCINLTEQKFDITIQLSLKLLGHIFGVEIYSRVFLVFTNLNQMKEKSKLQKIALVKSEYPSLLQEQGLPIAPKYLFYEHDNKGDKDGLADIPSILKEIKTGYIPQYVRAQLEKIKKLMSLNEEVVDLKIKKFQDFITNLNSKVKSTEAEEHSKIMKLQNKRERELADRDFTRRKQVTIWENSIERVTTHNKTRYIQARSESAEILKKVLENNMKQYEMKKKVHDFNISEFEEQIKGFNKAVAERLTLIKSEILDDIEEENRLEIQHQREIGNWLKLKITKLNSDKWKYEKKFLNEIVSLKIEYRLNQIEGEKQVLEIGEKNPYALELCKWKTEEYYLLKQDLIEENNTRIQEIILKLEQEYNNFRKNNIISQPTDKLRGKIFFDSEFPIKLAPKSIYLN